MGREPRNRRGKANPFSIRLSRATDRFVAAEARRTRRSRSAVVETLTEEAARMRRFPGLAFRGDDADRRPWVIGTGLDVWQIVEALDEAGSIDELVRRSDLGERHVALAASYREHYPDEVADAIADNRRSIDELRDLYPFATIEPLA